MIIEQPAIWLRWLYPRATWRMDKSERAVYLTFDDGPIPEATPFILDTLAHFGIKATFFMVGDNVRKHPELFQKVVAAGHRIGNHTFHHIGGFRHSIRHYNADAELADELLHTDLFRPPHGWMRLDQYFWLGRKYRIVMWDLVTRDYSKWMTPERVLDNVKRYARNGSIITFHDSLKSIDKLRYALPEAIKWLKEQGYEFKVFPAPSDSPKGEGPAE
jgi:peptidoglycan/xylan/chitin deacetylase (PgdA/CDA1 family)